jgi:hypothetical protein
VREKSVMSGSCRGSRGSDPVGAAVRAQAAVGFGVFVDRVRADIEQDVVGPVNAAPFADLQVNGPADDITRGQVFNVGGVALHKALAFVVDENAALAAHRLGDEDAQLVNAGGVELEELHILNRQPAAHDDGRAVTGVSVGVGSHLPHAPVPAGSQDDRFAVEDVQLAGRHLQRDHASHGPVHQQQVHHLELVKEQGVVLDTLLVQGLQDHMAGAVGGVARPAHGFAGDVVGMPAKGSLGDAPVGRARERQAHMLQVVYRINRLAHINSIASWSPR